MTINCFPINIFENDSKECKILKFSKEIKNNPILHSKTYACNRINIIFDEILIAHFIAH